MIRRTKRKFFMGIICLSLLLPLFSFGYSPKVEAASKEAVVKSKVIHYFAVTDIYMGTDAFWRSIWYTQYCYLQNSYITTQTAWNGSYTKTENFVYTYR